MSRISQPYESGHLVEGILTKRKQQTNRRKGYKQRRDKTNIGVSNTTEGRV